MEIYFESIDGRSIKNDRDLWIKFENARNTRKIAIHSFTQKVSFERSKKVLDDIMDIINWIELNRVT